MGGEDSRIRVKLGMTCPGSQVFKVKFEPLTDTGVRRTIMNKTDWKMISGKCNLMTTKLKFRPRKHRDTARRRWRGICRG